jgi:formamidopyrimidine-DNA glycosylase
VPELPEVETTRRGIARALVGRRLLGAVVRDPRLRWPVDAGLDAAVAGARVRAVDRRGKYLVLRLEGGTDVILHLGMSGSLRLAAAAQLPGRHDHVDLRVDGGRVLRLSDPRRFGAVVLAPGGADAHPLLAGLGVEPLSADSTASADFTAKRLHARSRGLRSAVKAFLMDARVVVGIGNIYASEALFRAGVRPAVSAGRVSLARYQRIVDAAVTTLSAAVAAGGTTLRDFTATDGRPGYFRQQLLVYGRGGQPCPRCGGRIVESRLGGRGTFHCPRCQR